MSKTEGFKLRRMRAWSGLAAPILLGGLLFLSGLVCVAPDARPGVMTTPAGGGVGGSSGSASSSAGSTGTGGSAGQGGAGGSALPSAIAPQPNIDWAVRIGNQAAQWARTLDVTMAGDVLIGGEFDGNALDIGDKTIQGSAKTDAFIAQLSKQDGSTVWARPIGENGDQRLGQIVHAPGGGNNIVLVGSFSEMLTLEGCNPITTNGLDTDIFIARLQSDGACDWVESFGSQFTDQFGLRVAVNAQGEIAVAGFFDGSVDFGGNAQKLDAVDLVAALDDKNIFVAKLEADGKGIWSRNLGITSYIDGNDVDLDLVFDQDNNLVITGSYLYELQTANGTLQNSDQHEWFAMKLAGDNGNEVWEMHSAESDVRSRRGLRVIEQAGGDLAIASLLGGSFELKNSVLQSGLDSDIGVLVFDKNGSPIWNKVYGGVGVQRAHAFSIDDAGNFLMGGWFNGVLDFSEDGTLVGNGTNPDSNRDLFFAKLSPQGAFLWAMRAGDAEPQSCAAIHAGKGSESYAIGTFAGRIILGSNTLDSDNNSNDVYVVRLSDQLLP